MSSAPDTSIRSVATTAADTHSTSGTGPYDGGVLWGVRCNEIGSEPRIYECNSEAEACGFYGHLVARYQELGRSDAPELVSARIIWERTAHNPT